MNVYLVILRVDVKLEKSRVFLKLLKILDCANLAPTGRFARRVETEKDNEPQVSSTSFM